MEHGPPPRYGVTADAIIVRGEGTDREVVLIVRKNPPFQGCHALPGGFLDADETIEECCVREAREETSLDVEIVHLVGVYSKPGRDPRGRTVTAAFLCRPVRGELAAADDAAAAAWHPVPELPSLTLAFDHGDMLSDAGLLG